MAVNRSQAPASLTASLSHIVATWDLFCFVLFFTHFIDTIRDETTRKICTQVRKEPARRTNDFVAVLLCLPG